MAEKEIMEIDIEGAEKIGEGAHSEVYRIADDTIVKVYRPSESLDRIRKEKELSRWAFVKGVPTAISFHVVRVGEQYGLIYEMLNACFAPDYIKKSEEHFEDFVKRSVDLMHQIHAIEVAPGELPDMKEQTRGWIEKCRKYMDAGICDSLEEFLDEIPDSHTLLHADYHIKNIMVSDSELMLIDMDTLCMGNPIFELATIYNSYKEFPSVSPEAAAFLGIDVATANRLWERTVALYVGESDREKVPAVERQAQILGC
ncbi:MAG: phosphotransferase, partial [Eubacterium sp.]|nr:phosphotransferase [Eubacterium sp.]